MSSDILQLAELVSKSAKLLVQTCEENKLPVPSLNDTFAPDSEAFRSIPAVADAANIIVAAAAQLASAVAPSSLSILTTATGVSLLALILRLRYLLMRACHIKHFRAAALRVCLETNVTEILREGGPLVITGHHF